MAKLTMTTFLSLDGVMQSPGGPEEDRSAELKSRPGGELQVHGSGDLAQTLIAHDLVDEYRLFVYPVILGRGKRLFEAGSVPTALRLVDTKTTSTGVAVHTYQRAGEMKYGSFALDQ